MARLPRLILNALTALSLLLCVATVVLWVRSYRATHRVEFWTGAGLRELRTAGGRVWFDDEPEKERDQWVYFAAGGRSKYWEEQAAAAGGRYMLSRGHGIANEDMEAFVEAQEANKLALRMRMLCDRLRLDWQKRWRATPPFSHSMPLSWPAAATTLLPIYWLMSMAHSHYRRRSRTLAGLCLQCGYSLTGNLSSVCPECGTKCSAISDSLTTDLAFAGVTPKSIQ